MSFGSMPGPSSETHKMTCSGRDSPLMLISPWGAYLMALEMRLVRTCRIRVSSARMMGNDSGKLTLICLEPAWVEKRSASRDARFRMETSIRLRLNPPAWRREASKRSSIIFASRSASSSMTAKLSLMTSLSQCASSRRRVLA